MTRLLRVGGYCWAFPVTCLGLCGVALARASGGECRVIRGVLEAHGGWVRPLLRLRWIPGGGMVSAITLGHVILGQDAECLDVSRNHEHVHVRQFERWGAFFIPAYFLSGAYLWCRGKNPYLDNPFEVEAYAVATPDWMKRPSDVTIRTSTAETSSEPRL